MVGSLLSSFRKIINVNFFLFILSLWLFAEIYNEFLGNKENIYEIFKNIELVIPYAILYLFIVTILTPVAKNVAILLTLIPFIDYVLVLFTNEEGINLRKRNYISLYKLKKIALERDSKTLYEYYVDEKEKNESMKFTSQFSFINLLLIIMNYFFVNNSVINKFILLNNFFLNFIVITALFFMTILAMTYLKYENRVIPIDFIPTEKSN